MAQGQSGTYARSGRFVRIDQPNSSIKFSSINELYPDFFGLYRICYFLRFSLLLCVCICLLNSVEHHESGQYGDQIAKSSRDEQSNEQYDGPSSH